MVDVRHIVHSILAAVLLAEEEPAESFVGMGGWTDRILDRYFSLDRHCTGLRSCPDLDRSAGDGIPGGVNFVWLPIHILHTSPEVWL